MENNVYQNFQFFQPLIITFICTYDFKRYEQLASYILTERRNFKIFWKENYAIALDGCCLLTKKMLNIKLNM